MKYLLILIMMIAPLLAEIKLSESELKNMKISTKPVVLGYSEQMGPFVGSFDFDDSKTKSYIVWSDATVVALFKKNGESVKSGELICKISSPELLSVFFELRELKQKLVALQNNEKKDAELYKEGVISFREYQKSSFDTATVSSKVNELSNRLSMAGISSKGSAENGFSIVATKSGILSMSPSRSGQKIDAFVAFVKISDENSFLITIKIPPKQVKFVKKGATINDKTGEIIGRVLSVSANVDELTNSATAIAKITNFKPSMRAGMSSEFYISSQKKEESIMLPLGSVTKYKNQDICFLKSKNGFEPKVVIIEKETRDGIYIKANGIKDGSSVAVGGIINLKGAISGMGFE